ncbi:DUF2796 domain-containing protein [Donghicola sp. XS_ASV15]|uniref:ZrgA family zinc uptake protein n=1 Tax=Donghicola sp. XS_ASV15 TaxID=3241295 RepID=UPI00351175EA
MKNFMFSLLASVAALPAFAEETREMQAHIHGVSTLEFAVEGQTAEAMLKAPGMDLVGFEYRAESEEDKAAVASALTQLQDPATVLLLPTEAGCELSEVDAHLSEDADHHDDHDDHHDEDHAEHEHEHEHEHADHEDEDAHNEFLAHYHFTCANPEALTQLTFSFFDTFAQAKEVDVTYVTDAGVGAAEATRDEPVISLK